MKRQLLTLASAGATRKAITKRMLEALEIAVPPLSDQARIAMLLGTLDDKIASNQRLAVRTEETLLAASSRVACISDAPREGWSVTTFAEAVVLNPKVKIARGTTTPFVEMAAVDPFATRPHKLARRDYAGGARFERGDTLFARITPCTEHGKGAFVDFVDEPSAGSTEFLVFRAKEPLTPEVVYALSRDERLRAHAIQSMTGTSGRQRVDNGCWASLPVAIAPPSPERDEGVVFMASAMRLSHSAWKEARRLIALRDELLPKLVSGKIRVPAAGQIVAAADEASLEEAQVA